MLIECVLLGASLCQTLKDKPVMLLAGAGMGASIADTHQTIFLLHRDSDFHERNPLAVPFVSHPPIAYAAAVGISFVSAVIAHRMRTSENHVIRKLWWVSSGVQFSLGLAGYIYTRRH